jgi:hypothetical protein
MAFIIPPPEIKRGEIKNLSKEEKFVRLVVVMVIIVEVVILALLA